MNLAVCFFLLHPPDLESTHSSKPSLVYAWLLPTPHVGPGRLLRGTEHFQLPPKPKEAPETSPSHSPSRESTSRSWGLRQHCSSQAAWASARASALPLITTMRSVIATKACKRYRSLITFLKRGFSGEPFKCCRKRLQQHLEWKTLLKVSFMVWPLSTDVYRTKILIEGEAVCGVGIVTGVDFEMYAYASISFIKNLSPL